MRACIFLGPSLALDVARRHCPAARFLPPAQQGSLIAAVERHDPQVIGIVDGYFRHRAAVWHKEILWALSRGIHVYGGASMGALRAAELDAYGMRGIGEIFGAYRAGALPPFDGLTDDDEVAVVHGTVEANYLAASDALVNIRWTLRAALRAKVIDATQHDSLLAIARAMPFARRRYRALLAAARPSIPGDALQRLEHWLTDGRIDQKAIDATAVVVAIASHLSGDAKAHRPNFELAEPEIWQAALNGDRNESLAEPVSENPYSTAGKAGVDSAAEASREREDSVLALLAEDDEAWQRVHDEALVYWLLDARYAGQPAACADEAPERASLHRQLDRWRQRHGLLDRESIDRWLHDNHLPLHRIDTLMGAEARRDAALPPDGDPAMRRLMIDRLKLSGDYALLANRALLADRT